MSGIDTSIYNNLLRPPKSVAEYDAEAMQGQQNRLALQSSQMQMADRQRGLADEQQMRGLVSQFGTDKTANYNTLLGSGRLKDAQAYEKANADTAKTQSEASENEGQAKKIALENIGIASTQHKNQLGNVTTREAAARWVIAAFQDPHLKSITERMGSVEDQLAQIPTDPVKFAEWKMQSSLAADKLIEYSRANANTIATNVQSNTNSLRSEASSKYSADSSAKSAAVGHRLKAQENRINLQGIVGKRTQDVELKLQDDYRSESKGFGETSGAMKKILGAISTADKNPGSALAAGTAFMKILDPNSVVRESELGMALNASGWFDRATNIAATIQSGKIMTPTQQKNLRSAAEDLFEEAKSAQREVDAAYTKRSKDYGADPKRVIVDRGQNTGRASSASTGAKFLGFEK